MANTRRRWSCEVANFYLKTQLGLGDFRVQSYSAVDKYMVVVLLTWAYVEQRFVTERSAQIQMLWRHHPTTSGRNTLKFGSEEPSQWQLKRAMLRPFCNISCVSKPSHFAFFFRPVAS